MAKKFKPDPQFNLKTGADSEFFFAREVTKKGNDLGKIIRKDGLQEYPFLARSTGNSIKGSTENIESNELRKGRTQSAPRKGNESSEGSLDLEFSPRTYDDMFEAGFRNSWKRWTGDTDSAINLKDNNGDKKAYPEDYFITSCGKSGSKRLLRFAGDDDGMDDEHKGANKVDDTGLILVPQGSVVHELTNGTKDVKYNGIRKYGGVENEDIYQEFKSLAVNTVALTEEVGQIVTGSIGFMGANNPLAQHKDEIVDAFGGTTLKDRFLDGKVTGQEYFDGFPEKSTNTDQFMTRIGFLRLSGKKIEYATSLDWTLDNGLNKKFALYVKNAIATVPLDLKITGNLKLYLVYEGSEEDFNNAVKDKDVELLFTLRDKEENPHYLYVFQIFKAKFTESDLSVSGKDTIELSLPWQSFGEQAMRIFRITLPQIDSAKAPYDKTVKDELPTKLIITPNVEITEDDLATFKFGFFLDDVELPDADVKANFDMALITDETDENYKRIVITQKVGTTPLLTRDDKNHTLRLHTEWNGEVQDNDILIAKNVVPTSITLTATPASIASGDTSVISVADQDGDAVTKGITYEITEDLGDGSGTDVSGDATKCVTITGDTLSVPSTHGAGTVKVKAIYASGSKDERESVEETITITA